MNSMPTSRAALTDDTLPPRSIERVSSDASDDSPEVRRSIQYVENRLLSFVDHQEELKRHNKEHPITPKHTISIQQELPIHTTHAYPCTDTHKDHPSPPSKWPQRPLMLRPTPHTATKIRGIRRASSFDYQNFSGFCAGCILPINTGREVNGESLVIDFESKHFVGTVLMRIKDAPPASRDETVVGTKSYFDNRKRRFQAVVKGKFKTPLKMSECVTGQVFSRPSGSLPARWIVTSFIKFVSTLAPQLEANIDGQHPRFLTPLVATAHTVLEKNHDGNSREESLQSDEPQTNEHFVDKDDRLFNFRVYAGAKDIEAYIEEPSADDAFSIMKRAPDASLVDAGSVSKRQRARKKAFNSISAKHAGEPCFLLDQEYSFEFYQHLLVFDDSLAIDMGRPVGKVQLAPITDGQPIKFMAAHKDPENGQLDELWSFDIWHESLYPYAQAAAGEETFVS